MGDQIEIQQIKQRKGRRSPIVKMRLDTGSGNFEYLDANTEQIESKSFESVGELSGEEIGI